jgi:predicted RNA binding protein YcfA (HicA-like mRNA interferase family)
LKLREVIKILQEAGFQEAKGGKGSHIKLKHPDGRITVLPMHGMNKDVPIGTLKAIEKQTGIKLKF